MNTKSLIIRTLSVFVALATAGVAVAVSSQVVQTESQQAVMIAIGSAMFGAALCFFLVRMFSIVEK